MAEWKKARKKPVEVEFREVNGDVEIIRTLEGDLEARKGKSFVIRGVKGEVYPIDKGIFYKTYDMPGEGAIPAATQLAQQLMRQFDEKHAFWLMSMLAKAQVDGLTVTDLVGHMAEVRPDTARKWRDLNKFEEIVGQILRTNKIGRDDLMSRIRKKREELCGFVTLEGCAVLVAKELGVEIGSGGGIKREKEAKGCGGFEPR